MPVCTHSEASHFQHSVIFSVTKLMERVETTFIKHFSNSNQRKGLNILRPQAKRERHRVTFTLGFLCGCTVAFLFALVLVTHARNIVNHERKYQYMETMFPLYGFGVAVFAIAGALANLAMEMDPKTQRFQQFTELVPQALLGCLRHLYEERDGMQRINALKYFSTIIAVTMRTAYELKQGIGWKTIAFISSLNAAIFGTYWDLVIDWGLLQKNSKNRWLRDKLLVPHNSVYFVAMVSKR
ncbi:hypothetical protein HYC85_007975 [Camellia sinensis]|uniref:EXS domain-containing protein n=1 Tax=Camellia sinensis TaxID=4442 RepID=A0A7J7HR54_CAMSI|nr:hypothetical protein HYC85_007975 [Camellia sinensis]